MRKDHRLKATGDSRASPMDRKVRMSAVVNFKAIGQIEQTDHLFLGLQGSSRKDLLDVDLPVNPTIIG